MARLGIIDWGIGGISIYKLIKERIGGIPITYFSDTGVTPYGKMSRGELVGRLDSVLRHLESRGITHLVIGCNAGSTALPFLNLRGLKVKGVIEPAVEMTVSLKPTRLGLIGGRRTVVSGVYRRAFAGCGIAVKQRVAQPLSALIESGDVSSSKLRAEACRILAPIRDSSHILLACTHYPAIMPVLKQAVSSQTVFIDPAAAVADIITGWHLRSGGEDDFLTSGPAAAMKKAAERAFGTKILSVQKLTIQ